MERKRSFEGGRVYTEDEIKVICPEASIERGKEEDETGYEYLVAPMEVEYWFVREGNGWKVDHVWGSFILTQT